MQSLLYVPYLYQSNQILHLHFVKDFCKVYENNNVVFFVPISIHNIHVVAFLTTQHTTMCLDSTTEFKN